MRRNKYMKTGKIRKVICSLLAASVLTATMSVTTFADGYGEHGIGVIFAYGGDHDDITFQGGWHKPASGNRFAVFYTTDDRQVLYCLEPGNHRDDDSTASRQDPDYIRNNLSNRCLSGAEIENFISLIMTYGYNGSVDGGQEVIDMGVFNEPITSAGGTMTVQLYEACQILIWETMVGERNSSFEYVAPDEGYSPVRSIHTTSGDSGDAFDEYYDHIVSYVKTHYDTPSFTVRSLSSAYSMEAVKPGDDDVIRFTDESDGTYMSNWDFDVIDRDGNVISGADVSKDGEDIEVTIPEDVSEAYLRATYNVTSRGAVAWSSDGYWAVGSDTQDLAQYNSVSPKVCYAKLGRDTGSITVHKSSDYGVIEGVEFDVYRTSGGTRNLITTMTTDSNGTASVDGLLLGTYEVEEHVPDLTSCNWDDTPVVTLSASSLDEDLYVTNTVDTVIRLHKTDAVTGEDIGYTTFAICKDSDEDGYISNSEREAQVEVRDDDGDSYIEFTGLGIGRYVITETEAYGNYEINEEEIVVNIEEPVIYDVTCEDDAFGSITVTKTDSEDQDRTLSGAVFAVYCDNDSDGLYDGSVDTIYGVMSETDDAGVYTITDLPRQDYLVREVSSPDGYELDTTYYPVTVSINDLHMTCSNNSYGTFSNRNGIAGTNFIDAATGDDETPSLGEEIYLTDNVSYQGLIAGEEYSLHMELMDKTTGETLTDENGDAITSDIVFIPEDSEGVTQITVSVDSYMLAGKVTVAYETMYRDGKIVGVHADINDEDQTLRFPAIGTQATGGNGSDKTITSVEETVIVDHVAYQNLIPGRDYRVTGTLMVQSTGEELQIGGESVVASTDFTAEEGAGEADVRFVFDAQELEGDVVVFEEVYDMKTGVKITEHKDINYKGQTVTLIKKTVPHIPSIPSIPGVPSVPEITETLTSTLPVPETGEGMSFVRNIGITILATGAIVFISLGLEGIKEKKKR